MPVIVLLVFFHYRAKDASIRGTARRRSITIMQDVVCVLLEQIHVRRWWAGPRQGQISRRPGSLIIIRLLKQILVIARGRWVCLPRHADAGTAAGQEEQ